MVDEVRNHRELPELIDKVTRLTTKELRLAASLRAVRIGYYWANSHRSASRQNITVK